MIEVPDVFVSDMALTASVFFEGDIRISASYVDGVRLEYDIDLVAAYHSLYSRL
jgi:hypothetical protein